MSGPFGTLDHVRYGVVEPVAPMIRRVIAENPSKFTYRGTGTYIVGHGDVAVIDPGPDLDTHRRALAAALVGERVRSIAVTHCHADHSPLAAWLHAETGAPTVAFGPHPRLDEPDDLGADGTDAPADSEDSPVEGVVEEAVDHDFVPDVAVADGDLAGEGPGWTLRAVHTPGHTSNHTCFSFQEESALFPGDHVMGWSTTVVAPPDGDMRVYLASLRKVQGRPERTWWPTHGPAITDPDPYVEFLVNHRLEREAQVLAAVRDRPSTVAEIVADLYRDVRPELYRPAGYSVLSHLIKLADDGLVAPADEPRPTMTATFAATG